jgi:gliding motility-associated-like protein
MRIFISILLMFTVLKVSATHNRAGEISYKQIGINQFEITLTTYTRIETEADRPFLTISWGDGAVDSLLRSPGFPQFISTDINKNQYTSIHTYPGPGTYTVSLEDPNRNNGIINIPNSVSVPFYIESQIIINPFLGTNGSPVLLNPPIDEACVDAIYQHNPSAFDEDGDSLAYSLVNPRGESGLIVPGYEFPAGLTINHTTGTVTWDKPTFEGEFNFAILINEYRGGFLIGSMVRDMQISVKSCNNQPPILNPIRDLCVVAGTTIKLTIKAKDPDSLDVITLTATGGPLSEVEGDLATFDNSSIGIDSVSGEFEWITGCSHVRQNPYPVYFKAQDNDEVVQLIDIQTLNIKILGPKTEEVSTEAIVDGIGVNWKRNICTEVSGYKVYRKINSTSLIPDSCVTGMPSETDYQLITTISGRNSTNFFDQNLIEGNLYCYRVVACFPDGAESIVSDEACSQTIEISPIPLNVDVITTTENAGEIFIRWKNPVNIDSLNASGNLFYKLYEVINGVPSLIYIGNDLSDTTFSHISINTTIQHNYLITLLEEITGQENELSSSETASSVFLTAVPADQTVELSWNYLTPWQNDTALILRAQLGVWEVIDTVFNNSYSDKNLTNGTEYCYKVMTIGGYENYDSILLNNSQQVCETPEDIIPPCVPTVFSQSDCDTDENRLYWLGDTSDCNADLSSITIYFKRFPEDEYNILAEITAPWTDTSFIHNGRFEVAGCYKFMATDSVGNQSEDNEEICFDNCPYYSLPNIFTPNDDGVNEILTPFPYKYVKEINLEIYNRWGRQVFKTNELDINWDGKHQLTKLNCSSGVYYYSCILSENRLEGVQDRIINGFIHLAR